MCAAVVCGVCSGLVYSDDGDDAVVKLYGYVDEVCEWWDSMGWYGTVSVGSSA